MVLDSLDTLNWPAVGAAVASAFVIGLLWFSPQVLGPFWARQVSRYTALPEGEITNEASRPTALSAWLGVIAVSAVALAVTAEAVGADSPSDGIVLGLVLGLGLGATLASWPPIFARMPWQWWLVNSGAFVLMQVAMGTILGAWS
jgi:hypothetical protein